MRVIGGSSRGRALRVPDLPGLRPTSDRAREAIFDILGSRGGVEGLVVLDLFAGSGALGIEALSRGARAATFVEQDRRAVEVIERNLEQTGILPSTHHAGGPSPAVEIVRSDALAYLRRGRRRYDVAFCDPPYAFAGWAELLRLVDADVAILESSREIEVPAGFEVRRVYRYGSTLVTLAERPTSVEAKGSV